MAIPGIHEAEQALSRLARERAQDADETRRLLYMALVAPSCKRYNLAGTLINALRHHHGINDEDLERNVIMLVNGDDEMGVLQLTGWARKQIQRCTDSLS